MVTGQQLRQQAETLRSSASETYQRFHEARERVKAQDPRIKQTQEQLRRATPQTQVKIRQIEQQRRAAKVQALKQLKKQEAEYQPTGVKLREQANVLVRAARDIEAKDKQEKKYAKFGMLKTSEEELKLYKDIKAAGYGGYAEMKAAQGKEMKVLEGEDAEAIQKLIDEQGLTPEKDDMTKIVDGRTEQTFYEKYTTKAGNVFTRTSIATTPNLSNVSVKVYEDIRTRAIAGDVEAQKLLPRIRVSADFPTLKKEEPTKARTLITSVPTLVKTIWTQDYITKPIKPIQKAGAAVLGTAATLTTAVWTQPYVKPAIKKTFEVSRDVSEKIRNIAVIGTAATWTQPYVLKTYKIIQTTPKAIALGIGTVWTQPYVKDVGKGAVFIAKFIPYPKPDSAKIIAGIEIGKAAMKAAPPSAALVYNLTPGMGRKESVELLGGAAIGAIGGAAIGAIGGTAKAIYEGAKVRADIIKFETERKQRAQEEMITTIVESPYWKVRQELAKKEAERMKAGQKMLGKAAVYPVVGTMYALGKPLKTAWDVTTWEEQRMVKDPRLEREREMIYKKIEEFKIAETPEQQLSIMGQLERGWGVETIAIKEGRESYYRFYFPEAIAKLRAPANIFGVKKTQPETFVQFFKRRGIKEISEYPTKGYEKFMFKEPEGYAKFPGTDYKYYQYQTESKVFGQVVTAIGTIALISASKPVAAVFFLGGTAEAAIRRPKQFIRFAKEEPLEVSLAALYGTAQVIRGVRYLTRLRTGYYQLRAPIGGRAGMTMKTKKFFAPGKEPYITTRGRQAVSYLTRGRYGKEIYVGSEFKTLSTKKVTELMKTLEKTGMTRGQSIRFLTGYQAPYRVMGMPSKALGMGAIKTKDVAKIQETEFGRVLKNIGGKQTTKGFNIYDISVKKRIYGVGEAVRYKKVSDIPWGFRGMKTPTQYNVIESVIKEGGLTGKYAITGKGKELYAAWAKKTKEGEDVIFRIFQRSSKEGYYKVDTVLAKTQIKKAGQIQPVYYTDKGKIMLGQKRIIETTYYPLKARKDIPLSSGFLDTPRRYVLREGAFKTITKETKQMLPYTDDLFSKKAATKFASVEDIRYGKPIVEAGISKAPGIYGERLTVTSITPVEQGMTGMFKGLPMTAKKFTSTGYDAWIKKAILAVEKPYPQPAAFKGAGVSIYPRIIKKEIFDALGRTQIIEDVEYVVQGAPGFAQQGTFQLGKLPLSSFVQPPVIQYKALSFVKLPTLEKTREVGALIALPATIRAPIQQPITALITVPDVKTGLKVDLIQTPDVGITQIQVPQQQVQVPLQPQIQVPQQQQVTQQITQPPLVPPPETLLLTATFSTPRERAKDEMFFVKGYKVFVRKGGKYKVLPGVFPKGEAIKKGERIVRETLAASWKIKETKQRIKARSLAESQYIPSPRVFRKYKIIKGKRILLEDEWIQRRRKRLISPFETGEMTLMKKQKGGRLKLF